MTEAQRRAISLAAVRGREALYDYTKWAEKHGYSGGECRRAVEAAITRSLAASRCLAGALASGPKRRKK